MIDSEAGADPFRPFDTKMDEIDFSWMVGRNVRVSFHDPTMWVFALGDSLAISAECPWRLIQKNQIVVSSDDHLQQYGLPAPIDAAAEASSLLDGATIQNVKLRDGTADLFIEFTGDKQLEIVPFSRGYESWQVAAPKGKSVVAQGGGRFSTY